jgi:hypothetical protein
MIHDCIGLSGLVFFGLQQIFRSVRWAVDMARDPLHSRTQRLVTCSKECTAMLIKNHSARVIWACLVTKEECDDSLVGILRPMINSLQLRKSTQLQIVDLMNPFTFSRLWGLSF